MLQSLTNTTRGPTKVDTTIALCHRTMGGNVYVVRVVTIDTHQLCCFVLLAQSRG